MKQEASPDRAGSESHMDAKMEALENYGLDDNTYISVLEELQTLQTKFNSLVDTLQENKNA
jgi:hypothetical protein